MKVKVDPDELRQVADELEHVKACHPDLMHMEPSIHKHIVDAQEEAMGKWNDLSKELIE